MSIKKRIRNEQLGQVILSGLLFVALLFISGKDLLAMVLPAPVVTNYEEFQAALEKNDGKRFRLEVATAINTYFYTYTDDETEIDEYVFLADMEDVYLPVLINATADFDGENTEVVEPFLIENATLADQAEYPELLGAVRKDLVDAGVFTTADANEFVPSYIVKPNDPFDFWVTNGIFVLLMVVFGFWFFGSLFSALGIRKPKLIAEMMNGGMTENEAMEAIDRQMETAEFASRGFALTREYLVALSPSVDGVSRSDIESIRTIVEKSGKGPFKTKQLIAVIQTHSGRSLRCALNNEEEANEITRRLNLNGASGMVYQEANNRDESPEEHVEHMTYVKPTDDRPTDDNATDDRPDNEWPKNDQQ